MADITHLLSIIMLSTANMGIVFGMAKKKRRFFLLGKEKGAPGMVHLGFLKRINLMHRCFFIIKCGEKLFQTFVIIISSKNLEFA